jgi:hypothetical protein
VIAVVVCDAQHERVLDIRRRPKLHASQLLYLAGRYHLPRHCAIEGGHDKIAGSGTGDRRGVFCVQCRIRGWGLPLTPRRSRSSTAPSRREPGIGRPTLTEQPALGCSPHQQTGGDTSVADNDKRWQDMTPDEQAVVIRQISGAVNGLQFRVQDLEEAVKALQERLKP